MADRKNFLDREKEKRDGENYLPYSIALIPGLTALEQDALVKDIAEGLVKSHGGADEKSVEDFIRERNVADRIEEYIQRMPEPLRDSWLMSASDSYGIPDFYRRQGNSSAGGTYDPMMRRVSFDKKVFMEEPHVVIHEYAHKTNHDLNLEHPYYKGERFFETVPDRMVGINLGKDIQKDFPFMFNGTRIDRFNKETVPDVYDAVYRSGYLKPTPMEVLLSGDRKKYQNSREHTKRVQELTNDIFNLRPNSLPSQVNMLDYGGHSHEYRDDHYRFAKRQGENLFEKGKTRDFITPDGQRLEIEYSDIADAAENAALSTEGAAEIADVLATEGGRDYIKTKFPRTYETMMDAYRTDPRRVVPKETLRPWQMYSHESPYNVYEYRGEPVPYNKDEVRRYTRVPDPYGGWYYGDDFQDVRKNALRQKKNYVEYRDLDGKWKRFYPEELKHVDAKFTTTKDFAKMLGKKLLKGAK